SWVGLHHWGLALANPSPGGSFKAAPGLDIRHHLQRYGQLSGSTGSAAHGDRALEGRMMSGLLDLLLAVSLLLLAWKLLRAKDIFVSVVLFIVFGLLMALAWVQLEAPDIA